MPILYPLSVAGEGEDWLPIRQLKLDSIGISIFILQKQVVMEKHARRALSSKHNYESKF
ncbi:hypothetical protein MTBBW1_1670019 [Desulfamplus magnetovallimortis]|uniref:Uncharacterized protein n=1 Tax=Desulfamplus magnetovallimortis TaxID=1246637 RepID=A0A1W1H975_9BACT|nr:hypothetical protein MTBBW1_1670019 [Desulfamplus magnetovallimortis]